MKILSPEKWLYRKSEKGFIQKTDKEIFEAMEKYSDYVLAQYTKQIRKFSFKLLYSWKNSTHLNSKS